MISFSGLEYELCCRVLELLEYIVKILTTAGKERITVQVAIKQFDHH